MHETKAKQIQDKIENGESDVISWAELWDEFTGLQDDRQLAALNRLSPGTLKLIIELCEKALPISRKRSLETYAQQAKRDGVDLELLAKFLLTGEIADEQFNSLPSVSHEAPAVKSKSRYLPPEILKARKELITKLLNQGKPTGEIVNEVMRQGLSKTKSSVYPAISVIKNNLEQEKASQEINKTDEPTTPEKAMAELLNEVAE